MKTAAMLDAYRRLATVVSMGRTGLRCLRKFAGRPKRSLPFTQRTDVPCRPPPHAATAGNLCCVSPQDCMKPSHCAPTKPAKASMPSQNPPSVAESEPPEWGLRAQASLITRSSFRLAQDFRSSLQFITCHKPYVPGLEQPFFCSQSPPVACAAGRFRAE